LVGYCGFSKIPILTTLTHNLYEPGLLEFTLSDTSHGTARYKYSRSE